LEIRELAAVSWLVDRGRVSQDSSTALSEVLEMSWAWVRMLWESSIKLVDCWVAVLVILKAILDPMEAVCVCSVNAEAAALLGARLLHPLLQLFSKTFIFFL
jgi:hypothetical protein